MWLSTACEVVLSVVSTVDSVCMLYMYVHAFVCMYVWWVCGLSKQVFFCMFAPCTVDVSGAPTGSVIILYQLQDKQVAHNRYMEFLTEVGLLNKVSI